MFTSFTYLKYETSDRVAFITLNRPDKRNALNFDVISELKRAFSKAEQDSDVKVVILNAEGKAFCAGADLEYLQKLTKFTYNENLSDSQHLKELLFQIYSLNKIVVAQVQGHAIAGGAGLVSVCDFAFSVPEATFGYTEVKLGFIPAIVSVFLLRKIGEGKVRELLLSGSLISAEKALQFNLINRVISAEKLEEETLNFAREIAETTSSHSIALTKELCVKVQDMTLGEGLSFACQLNAKMRETDDFKRGVGAFLRKETPKW